MSIKVNLVDSVTGKATADSILTFPVDFIRRGKKKHDVVIMVRKKADGSMGIIPIVDTEKKDTVQKMREFTVSIGDWVLNNYESANSGEIKINFVQKDVEVYVDDEFIGINKKLLTLRKGKHDLVFIKEGFPVTSKKITVFAGVRKKIDIDISKTEFYADLSFESYPENATVTLDGRKVGVTPCGIKNIRNGSHKVEFKIGKKNFENDIKITVEGEYKLFGLFNYKNNLQVDDKKVLKTIKGDKGHEISWTDNGIIISGKVDNKAWEGSGFCTPLFKAGKLTSNIVFNSRTRGVYSLFGIVDEYDNGILIGNDGKFYQYSAWGDLNIPAFIMGKEVTDKGEDNLVNLSYNGANGKIEAKINNDTIVNTKVKLKGRIKLVMLTDSLESGKEVNVNIRNFNLKNE